MGIAYIISLIVLLVVFMVIYYKSKSELVEALLQLKESQTTANSLRTKMREDLIKYRESLGIFQNNSKATIEDLENKAKLNLEEVDNLNMTTDRLNSRIKQLETPRPAPVYSIIAKLPSDFVSNKITLIVKPDGSFDVFKSGVLKGESLTGILEIKQD